VVFGNNTTYADAATSPFASMLLQKIVGRETKNLDVSDQKYSRSSVDVGCSKLDINKTTFDDRETYLREFTRRGTSDGMYLTVTGGMILQLHVCEFV
jgi:hypothetical protein